MILLFIIAIPIIACLASALTKKSLAFLGIVAACASVLEFIAVGAVVAEVARNQTYYFQNTLFVDSLGAILILILALAGAMAAIYSIGYLKNEMEKKVIGFRRVRQFFVLLHLFILAMLFAITTTDPIFTWIAIEATTLSTAFLISFYNKPASIEAAWKYLIINSIGLLLGFFGILLFLYPFAHGGTQGLISWQNLLASAKAFDPFIVKIAFVFVLVGFGTKVGLVPMHTWLPDAHSKAPAPISSLLSGILLNVSFLAILRFKGVTDLAIGKNFASDLLIFFGLLSIVVEAFFIFIQKNYKRMLAYSSIEHMGVAALGFGFGGPAAYAGLLHMVYHSLAKSSLFLSSGNILLKYSSTKMANVQGMIKTLPWTSILFFIGFLTMAGVPPFGIFITEFSILAAGFSAHPVASLIALFSFALVFTGILKHINMMVFGEPKNDLSGGEAGVLTVAPIMILIATLIVLSLYLPEPVRALLHTATINY